MLLQFKWIVRQITRIPSDLRHATQWLLNGACGTWLCCCQRDLLTQMLWRSPSAYCCAMVVTRQCVSTAILLPFFSPKISSTVPNKTEGTMTLKCMLKPRYSCGDRSGRSGTGSSRLSFRVVIFITFLWLPWRLVLACRNSQSSKTFCRSVLVQRRSSCAVLVFTECGSYLRRAQSPS